MAPRTAIVGGGSTHWAPRLLVDFANTPGLEASEVTLMDVAPDALPPMVAIGEHVAKSRDIPLATRGTTDLAVALEGADFVVSSFSVGGFDSMQHDIEIPARFGVRQPVGDSVGPGGIARALRSVPIIVDIARAMEQICPDAILLNVTNPLSALCRAVSRETSVTTVGLCNEVVGQKFVLSLMLGVGMQDIDPVVAGVNHLPLVTSMRIGDEDGFELIRDALADPERLREQGLWMDPLPEAMHYTKLSSGTKWSRQDVAANNRLKLTLFEELGVLPFASDTHVAEFFPWFVTESSDFGREWSVHQYGMTQHRSDKAGDDMAAEELLGSADIPRWPSGELVAPLIAAVAGGREAVLPVNLPNSGQVVGIGEGCVVECMGRAGRDGVEARDVAEVPSVLGEWLRRIVASQELTVEAALSGSRTGVLEAMMADPMAARMPFEALTEMTDELLAATAAWLPRFRCGRPGG